MTIFALSTGPGISGIAVIRISGDNTKKVIAIDLFPNKTNQRADIVFPAAGPTEIDGTFTNLEGRISVVSRKVTPPGTARPDWMIAVDLAHYLNKDLDFNSVEEIWAEIEKISFDLDTIKNNVTFGEEESDFDEGNFWKSLRRPR